MELDYKKNVKKQIIIILLVTIIFVAIFSVLGIKFAQNYNKKLIAKNTGNNEQIQNEVQVKQELQEGENLVSTQSSENNVESENNNAETVNDVEENTENANSNRLPVYSESAKKKMKKIYSSNEKIAYLTFDDGPSQTVTPQILDLLKKENIKATFFVLGSCVKANPELVKREYEEGHYIANHGYTHEYSKIYASVDSVLDEYNRTEAQIQKAIGVSDYHSHLFRFPGGSTGGKYESLKSKAKKELNKQNISYLDWNALTNDAAGANTKKKILSNLKSTVKGKNSVVILMHDASNKILTYETLSDIIQYLRDEGYTFDNFYSIMQ